MLLTNCISIVSLGQFLHIRNCQIKAESRPKKCIVQQRSLDKWTFKAISEPVWDEIFEHASQMAKGKTPNYVLKDI